MSSTPQANAPAGAPRAQLPQDTQDTRAAPPEPAAPSAAPLPAPQSIAPDRQRADRPRATFGAARRFWAAAGGLAAPGLRLMLRLRLARGKELPGRLAERRGIDRSPRPPGRLLWLHAASVGETTSILPVLPPLLASAPDLTVLVTTGTVTAAALLAQRLTPEQQPRVLHRFVPLDVPGWVGRFLDHWRPDAVAFLESELWPNLLFACHVRHIKLMLVNARLSPRSFARWRRVPWLARDLLGVFDRVQARSAADAERLRTLGARCVEAPGDLKFAAAPLPFDPTEFEQLRALLAGRPVWLAASTHPAEEAIALAAHRQLATRFPRLLTILAPRHPERGAAIAAEAAPLPVARRALGDAPPSAQGVWLVDTLGEMGLWYRLVPVVFVGRSLVPPGGGQNLLEPARLGCAIAAGPHTGNFLEHVALLRTADALVEVADVGGLVDFVAAMLADPARRHDIGCRAAAIVQRHGDLANHTAAALLDLLTSPTPSVPDRIPTAPSAPTSISSAPIRPTPTARRPTSPAPIAPAPTPPAPTPPAPTPPAPTRPTPISPAPIQPGQTAQPPISRGTQRGAGPDAG